MGPNETKKNSFRFIWHRKGQWPTAVNAVNVHHAIITHTYTHTTNTLWQIHNMQSGVPYRVCVCVQTGLGWSQRADRVNSGVNCVSGGPRREVTLPPGNTERYSTAKSPPHIYKTHLRHHNHKTILHQCRSSAIHRKQQVLRLNSAETKPPHMGHATTR